MLLLDLCNGIVKEGSIPEDWKSSVVLPIYKGKGDPMECGSYRGIKLLEHAMKVHTHTHTHTRLTALCPGLPGSASTRKVKPIWILLEQEIVSGSGISWAYAGLHLAPDR